jgi:hypothetical protein
MSAPDDTTAPAELAEDSSVKGAFTAFELAFEAWMASEWPHWNNPTTVFYWQKRAAFRAGFDAGVGSPA